MCVFINTFSRNLCVSANTCIVVKNITTNSFGNSSALQNSTAATIMKGKAKAELLNSKSLRTAVAFFMEIP